MKYRSDKKTGTALSALGFGCMRFSRNLAQIDYKRAESLIVKAVELGVNYFDTAHLYFGSEEVLGSVLDAHDRREKVCIATKLPVMLCRSPQDFDRLFEAQLQKLKTTYIDYYLIHNLQDTATWNRLKELGAEDWIAGQKASGRIRQLGFSFHGAQSEFMALLDAYGWDFCQIQYNYMNENFQAGTAGLKRAAEKGLSVIVMEPLLGGKLAAGLPKKAEALFREAAHDSTPAEWALKWLWNHEAVTVVLSGMNRMEQLLENAKAANSAFAGMLSDDELKVYEKVAAVFAESYKVPCTGCQYCMPCPQNVNIPGCFTAYNTRYASGFIAGMTMHIQDFSRRSPGNCVKCGQCEKHCPQHIKIMDELVNVKRTLEPFWLRAGYALFRKLQPKP